MFEIFREVHWAYLSDMKSVACMVTAIAAFVASGFVSVDLLYRSRAKIPANWRPTLLLMLLIKLSIGVFASIRFFDALHDLAYLAENPDVETTVSQNVPILEIPFLGIGITLIVFILVYSLAYSRLPRPFTSDKKKTPAD